MDIWIIAYVLPVLIGLLANRMYIKKPTQSLLLLHSALLVSICISQYILFTRTIDLPWLGGMFSGVFFVLSTSIACIFLGKNGFLYSVSAGLQEFTIFSICTLLFLEFSFGYVFIMVVPFFVVMHDMNSHIYMQILGLLIMGSLSVTACYIGWSIYGMIAIHTLIGVYFIKKSILYS